MQNTSRLWKLLKESAENSNYIIFVRKAQFDSREGVVFYKSDIEHVINSNDNVDPYDYLYEKAQAMIVIRPPDDPCNGAWEVKKIAVAKNQKGKLAYDLGYFMSDTHTLVPDRAAISDKAANAWKNFSAKTSQKKPLDDDLEPRNSDPNDDCQLWWGSDTGILKDLNVRDQDELPNDYADVLNHSYTKTPDYSFSQMQKEGEKLIAASNRSDEIMTAIWQECSSLFQRRMSE